ncbi:MAG: hypothetical protein H6979_05810 [Chromatiales bacterium]|nr:hypothetical protein [Chromatiales bacterium]
MQRNDHRVPVALIKALAFCSLLASTVLFAGEPAEQLVIRIEAVDVPAREIRANGTDYSLSGRATVTWPQGTRLELGELKPGMRVRIGLAKPGESVVDSVVLLPD